MNTEPIDQRDKAPHHGFEVMRRKLHLASQLGDFGPPIHDRKPASGVEASDQGRQQLGSWGGLRATRERDNRQLLNPARHVEPSFVIATEP
jgi:hypothetical protein